MQQIVFGVFAGLIGLCSLMVIASRNPVKSAVYLVGNLFFLAGLYAMLDAHFVAAIQILVYAGAIVVLFLFVIMLLNLQPDKLHGLRFSPIDFGAAVIAFVGLLIVLLAIYRGANLSGISSLSSSGQGGAAVGTTQELSLLLLGDYIWPFELASILILLAIVASVVIAKKDHVKPAAQNPEVNSAGH